MGVILGTILTLAPLLIAPHLVLFFDVTPKIAVILIGAAAALAAMAVRGELTILLSFRTGKWLTALLAVQFASLLLSTIYSFDPRLSFGGTNWRRQGLVVYTAILILCAAGCAHLAARWFRWKPLYRVMAAAGTVAAAYGIAQYFGFDPLLPSSAYHAGEGAFTIVRPPGPLGYVSYFATYLLFVCFTGVTLALHEQRLWWKALGSITAALATFAIILSGTRAAILGLLAGIVVLLLWTKLRFRLRPAVIAFTAALCAALLFYYSPFGTLLRNRVHWAFDEPRGGARPLLWRDSLRMAGERWSIGYGPDTFGAEFPRFEGQQLARAFPDFYHESPHNMLLDALCGTGAPGLTVLLALCGLGFLAAYRARSAEPLLSGCTTAALAAAVVSLQFTCFIPVTALYFYFLIAVMVAAAAPRQVECRPVRRRREIATAVVVGGALTWFALSLLMSDLAFATADRSIDKNRMDDAARAYGRALGWSFPGEGADLWFSRRMLSAAWRAADSAGRNEAAGVAMTAAQRATSTAADRQNAWYNLAGFQAARNDYGATEASLRRSVSWAPNWFKPHWTLARVLQLSGRLSEAEREAEMAVNLDGGKHPEVNLTLKEIRALTKGTPASK